MAVNANAVRVAGTGEVYYAATGTTAPTDSSTALPVAWTGLGYTSTDGVAFSFGRDTADIDAWQGSKLRVVTNSEPATVGFTLMETKTATLLLAFGGGTVVTTGGAAVYTPPDAGTNTERAMVVDFTDGSVKYRYYFPRVSVESDVAFTLTDGEAVAYALSFGVLDGSPKWKLFSNDSTNLITGS